MGTCRRGRARTPRVLGAVGRGKGGHPQWLEAEVYCLTILQRRLAKKSKGSRNREKIRRPITRRHERVANRRHDFLQKLSTDLRRRLDTVCIEDLNVAGMARHHAVARRLAQSGWAEFRRQLEYKAQWYGKYTRHRTVGAVLAPLSLWLLAPRSHAGRPSVELSTWRTLPSSRRVGRPQYQTRRLCEAPDRAERAR